MRYGETPSGLLDLPMMIEYQNSQANHHVAGNPKILELTHRN